jgi:CMP-2-keto-3-deoxyoctulosonic acid synthetase
MVQCCYPLTEEERSNINVVKAVINNGKIIYLTRTPDRELMYSPNLVGINGLYVYDLGVIMNFPEYDQELVYAHKGLDTLAFIGIVDVIPYMISERTPAVDVPSDIKLVEKYLDRQKNS